MYVYGNLARNDDIQKGLSTHMNNFIDFSHFSKDTYISEINRIGLKKVWTNLIAYLFDNGIKKFSENIIDFYDIGKLYEIGLAQENKFTKKECGKYYTPKDVSAVMAKMLCQNENLDAVADVGCGCGNLIISVLEELEKDNRLNKAIEKGIYIYDFDETALEICTARIQVRFGIPQNKIHKICGDFLALKKIPENLSVIANPPYVSNFKFSSDVSDASDNADVNQANDLYIAFFSKICDFAKNITIVTPQSFIVGKKFSLFRQKLNEHFYGDIYSFDNVPCPLFNGKKAGIFNTNNANGVRASISNVHRKTIDLQKDATNNSSNEENGFRLSHLIRFKTEQREKIINTAFLESTLGNIHQNLEKPVKAFKSLEKFAFAILDNYFELETLLSEKENEFPICVATSARYFISASSLKQKRSGFFEIFAKDKESFNLLYALLNSSYCYMWYRFFDGGILLPKALVKKIPIPTNLNYDKEKLDLLISKISVTEENFKSYKKNGGSLQEVIKFPESMRNELNTFLFGDINFSCVHRNYEEV